MIFVPTRFWIYYADGSVKGGTTKAGWRRHPDEGVLHVVAEPGYGAPHLSPWAGLWRVRAWTGLDEYDPFGWGAKRGQKVSDAAYRASWRGLVDAHD